MKRRTTLLLMFFTFLFSFGQEMEGFLEKSLNRDFLRKDLKQKKAVAREASLFAYTQKLDSVINLPYGLNDSRKKEVMHYDSNGFNDQIIHYNWNQGTGLYDEASKNEYVHDSRGNITEETNYLVDYIVGMTPYEKYERTYNQNDQMLTEVKSTFQYQGSKQWVNDSKDENTYNSQGYLLETLNFFWDPATNQWIKRFKTEYTYNTGGNESEFITFSWDSDTQQWNNSMKYEYEYNSDDLLATSKIYIWDKTTMSWENQQKFEYTYLTDGNISKINLYQWDKSSKRWVRKHESLYAYNSSGDLVSLTNYGDLFGGWKLISSYEYTYNDNSDISDILLSHTYEYVYDQAKHELVEEKYYVGRSLTDDKSFYYSKQSSLAVDDLNKDQLRIYPNPVRDLIHIRSESKVKDVEIFSLLGQSLKVIKEPAQTISLDDLSRGIYMIRIRSKEGVAVRKLIKL